MQDFQTPMQKHLLEVSPINPLVSVVNFKGLGSHCKAKTIGRGSSNEKSPFLLLPNQTKLAVPYDMKRSCINASSVPKKISGRLVQQYTNNMPCPFFISDTECGVKK